MEFSPLLNKKDFVDLGSMHELREKVLELLDVESGLTNWEIDFIDSLQNWSGCFTVGQAKRLEKIHDRIIG